MHDDDDDDNFFFFFLSEYTLTEELSIIDELSINPCDSRG